MVDINKSILNRGNFRLLIDKIPNVEYYVKSVNLPGMTFTEAVQPAGIGVDVYFPGDKVEFEQLEVTFLVDEDLENFKEIYDWMGTIIPFRNPDKYTGYTDPLGQFTDITLVITTNKNIPVKYIKFRDCIPTSLQGVGFESGGETDTITCNARFRFAYYEFE